MKKNIFILTVLIVVLLTTVVGYSAAKGFMDKKEPSDYHIGISYDESLKSDKPSVVLFYVDWCGYCMRFMPRYKILSTLYKDKYNFVMVDAEGEGNRKIVEDALISGFPTVYIYDNKYDNRVHLTQGLYSDLGLMRKELDRYLRIRSILDSADNDK